MSVSDASVLITGGTGSFGNGLVGKLLADSSIRRVAIYSRDEFKQSEMRERFHNNQKLRWFLGDIRDKNRLVRALHNVDYVYHAAALKQVDTGEYNPMEFINTNVLGSQNVIEAAIECGVRKVIALSTDKASSPINLYGATKLTADKLFIAANNYSKAYGTSFAVVRYGNVMASRGSVIPFFRHLAASASALPITDLRMTRFWISISDAVNFVLNSMERMDGGELFVPKIPSMRIVDLARAISPTSSLVEIGLRPGEKLHEEMIATDDTYRTIELEDRFIVCPVIAQWGFNVPEGIPMQSGLAYRSDTNSQWLDQSSLEKLIAEL